MEIKEYKDYKAQEIRRLYTEVGWVAYTENMQALEQGYKNSLLVLAAYENDELLGIIRVFGNRLLWIYEMSIPWLEHKGE